jgi:hypothetical protein
MRSGLAPSKKIVSNLAAAILFLSMTSFSECASACSAVPVFAARACVAAAGKGCPDSAAAACLATLVVNGEDTSVYFFQWMHEGKKRHLQMYVLASRELLSRLPALRPSEKTSAMAFLCDASLGDALPSCSIDEIRKRLDRISDSAGIGHP